MSDDWRTLIAALHAASVPTVIVVTGGGASAIGDLLSVPGGSRTLLEGVVPYAEAALVDWLGKAPDHFCAEDTALAMATVACRRGAELQRLARPAATAAVTVPGTTAPPASPVLGVACTASLVSERPKKGDHRCHVAVHSERGTATCTLVLEKGARDRLAEERLVTQVILLAQAQAAGIANLPVLELRPGEALVEARATAAPLLVKLLAGACPVVWSEPGAAPTGLVLTDKLQARPPAGVLCGSFHPLHDGHRRLREVAEQLLDGPVYYEMSIRNVDKPPLDYLSIDRRRTQFPDVSLALTAAPTFADKVAALPGLVFVVGADTAERIVQPKYYGGSPEAMRGALQRIRDAGCRFLVAGRADGERFETLSDIPVPGEFQDLFAPIPAELFRVDVSSTQLRRAAGG